MIPPFIKDFDKIIQFITIVVIGMTILAGTVGFWIGRLTAPTKVIEKITDTK